MIERRNDNEGYVEYLNEDIAHIVCDLERPCAILLDMNASKVIGYRVYEAVPRRRQKLNWSKAKEIDSDI